MVTSASATNSFSTAAVLGGALHGGNQLISRSAVKLYAAGSSGYGKGATLYATATSYAPSGSFQFTKLATNTGVTDANSSTWGCPATGNPQMSLIASGGNTVGTGTSTNLAVVFAVAPGACSGITTSTFVVMNEVTSVATMAALQQYLNPTTEQFGSRSTVQAAFANGVSTIANLVNLAGGYRKPPLHALGCIRIAPGLPRSCTRQPHTFG